MSQGISSLPTSPAPAKGLLEGITLRPAPRPPLLPGAQATNSGHPYGDSYQPLRLDGQRGPVFIPPRPGLTGAFAVGPRSHTTNGNGAGTLMSPYSREPVFTRPPPRPEPAAPAPAPQPQAEVQVDNTEEAEEQVSSPYARPSRVPLCQLDPAAIAARFGPAAAREILEETDPGYGKDTGTQYSWPPPDPQDPRWLQTMEWGLGEDSARLHTELARVREMINNALVESTLLEAELDEELAETARFIADVEHVAGSEFAEFLQERADNMWVPPYEVDDYEDEEYIPEDDTQGFTNDFTTEGVEPMVFQEDDSEMMADNTRPSDTLSYFDPDPRTSPLANRSANRSAKRSAADQPDSPSPSKRMRSNAPEPTFAGAGSSYMRGCGPSPPPDDDDDRPSHHSCNGGSHHGADEEEEKRSGAEDEDEGRSHSSSPQPIHWSTWTPYPRSPAGSDVDSQWSDLVSPDAPLPRGWPDNMSPRNHWMLKTEWYQVWKNPPKIPGLDTSDEEDELAQLPGGEEQACQASGSGTRQEDEEKEEQLEEDERGKGVATVKVEEDQPQDEEVDQLQDDDNEDQVEEEVPAKSKKAKGKGVRRPKKKRAPRK